MTNDDYVLKQQENTKIVQDTIILQKVNRAHREAFRTKFPGQCEHIMRLIAERLHAILVKKPDNISDINQWISTPREIADMSRALKDIHDIYKELTHESNT